jgi:hypothetical protein
MSALSSSRRGRRVHSWCERLMDNKVSMADASSAPDGAPRAGRRRTRRILLWTGGALVVLLGICAAAVVTFVRKF